MDSEVAINISLHSPTLGRAQCVRARGRGLEVRSDFKIINKSKQDFLAGKLEAQRDWSPLSEIIETVR